MKNQTRFSILASLAALAAAPCVHAQEAPASILFMRTNYRAVDSSKDTVLYRVQPSGANVVQLTPITFHVDYQGGSWSPSGSSIVYERADQATPDRSQLFVVDRQGASPRRITSGAYRHQQASWGPGPLIAFISQSNQDCVAVVRANATGQRNLFCPPVGAGLRADMVLSRPQWTPSGNGVLVDVGAYEANLEPRWFSRVYRVNVTTGAATLMTEQVFGDPDTGGDSQTLSIAPDGRHGIYADESSDLQPMELVDFATDVRTPLSVTGYMPRFSKDGRKIAFVRNNRIYVMRADGTNVRPAMAAPGTNAVYRIADWSADGTRLLVNKIANDRLLQIVTLSTGQARTVTPGTSFKDDWYQP